MRQKYLNAKKILRCQDINRLWPNTTITLLSHEYHEKHEKTWLPWKIKKINHCSNVFERRKKSYPKGVWEVQPKILFYSLTQPKCNPESEVWSILETEPTWSEPLHFRFLVCSDTLRRGWMIGKVNGGRACTSVPNRSIKHAFRANLEMNAALDSGREDLVQ